jgi:exocyst complex component 4
MCRQETHLELQLLGQGTVTKGDMVASPRNLSALGSLYHSVVSFVGSSRDACKLKMQQTWFSTELNALRSSPEVALSPTTPRNLEPISATTPYTPFIPLTLQVLPNEQLKLPLSQPMALLVISITPLVDICLMVCFRRFQALLKTYEQLAEIILHSIRIEMRCRTIHFLDAAMRHVRY